MSREVERSNWTARWRAEVHLSTGKVLLDHSDWTQAHWDEHKQNRQKTLARGQSKARTAVQTYGVSVERIVLVEETRNVLSITETYESEKFHSEHYLEAS